MASVCHRFAASVRRSGMARCCEQGPGCQDFQGSSKTLASSTHGPNSTTTAAPVGPATAASTEICQSETPRTRTATGGRAPNLDPAADLADRVRGPRTSDVVHQRPRPSAGRCQRRSPFASTTTGQHAPTSPLIAEPAQLRTPASRQTVC